MKIRSITCFCNPSQGDFRNSLIHLKEFLNDLAEEIEKKGWEIQSFRLATTPFGNFTNRKDRVKQIQEMEELTRSFGFTYLSVGPARLYHRDEFLSVSEILTTTKNVFLSANLTHPYKGISMQAIRDCAAIIVEAAGITSDGFTNLRFCASSKVSPFTPFFPSSYSYGSNTAFAFAMECADAAVSAFSHAKDLSEGRQALLSALNEAACELSKVSELKSRRFNIPFKGFDFSLAPFPKEWCSIGRAMEILGTPQVGMSGSLAAAAILTNILDEGRWLRAGFNGLMLPVLEDHTLAARSESGNFSIKDLLIYSAVCGTGLDTVPLPGDISAEKIEALLVDLAALSLRLNKPLTARLMPIPGKKSGEKTNFDFEFFKNGSTMDFPAEGLGGLMRKADWIQISKR